MFLYYGDGSYCAKNYLCIKYGTPDWIRNWLLNEGYLFEVYQLAGMMGTFGDEKYAARIWDLYMLDDVTPENIRKLDIRMPSCCSCVAVCKEMSEMPDFKKAFEKTLAKKDTGHVMTDEQLDNLRNAMVEACSDEYAYDSLSRELPYRYI